MKTDQKVFKIASMLLQYPSKEWMEEMPIVKLEIDQIHDSLAKMYLHTFIHYLEATPFNELCEKYVYTFDYHGIATLHLTYPVFKDSRQRGEALVKLRQLFKAAEVEAATDELPDYLPLILEFLSLAKEEQITEILKLHYKSIERLHDDLVKEDSEYHFVLKAIKVISEQKLENKDVS